MLSLRSSALAPLGYLTLTTASELLRRLSMTFFLYPESLTIKPYCRV
jgi:hypothetical protein